MLRWTPHVIEASTFLQSGLLTRTKPEVEFAKPLCARRGSSDSGDLLAGVRAHRLIEDCFNGDVYHVMHRRKSPWSRFHLLDGPI